MDQSNQKKLVAEQKQWDLVTGELEAENLKLMSYDTSLLSLFGNVQGKKVLDYGAGPGVLALAVKKLGGDTKVYDINEDLRNKSAEKIGTGNVYNDVDSIPSNYFDTIICNLVLCIVPEDEAQRIMENIQKELVPGGKVYVGFCNPEIFEVKESQLDYRFPTGESYSVNHQYKKIKKEGGYEIIEDHRPIEWYENIYKAAGLKLLAKHYTPEYELNGKKIKDFIIFELSK